MTSAASPPGTQWVSFVAEDGDSWLFDLSFFSSRWRCIYGAGCAGIEEVADRDGHRGCCSYGAHFADPGDLDRVMRVALALPPSLWQNHEHGATGDDIDDWTECLTTVDGDGDRLTITVDGACVFLNREGFETGPGCALHYAAAAAEIEPLEWKPEVCWQLPIRVEHHVDDNGHHTHFVRQWTRADWGESGDDLAWWCAEDTAAYSGTDAVAYYLRAEITALAGKAIADALIEHIDGRGAVVSLPLPSTRR
jgi:hypothetical protein